MKKKRMADGGAVGDGAGRGNWESNMQRRLDMLTKRLADNPDIKDKLTARIDAIKARMAARASNTTPPSYDGDGGRERWRDRWKERLNQQPDRPQGGGYERWKNGWRDRLNQPKGNGDNPSKKYWGSKNRDGDWKNKNTPNPNPNPNPGPGPVIPASSKWSDIVGAYFPKTMKAGGIVKKGGAMKTKKMAVGGMAGRGVGLPPGLAKRAPGEMPKGLMNRPGGMPPGLKPKMPAVKPATMKKGGMVMRGSGCATKGKKISSKMG